MKLYNEEMNGFNVNNSIKESEIVRTMKRAIINHAIGYDNIAITEYKKAFNLMLEMFDPTSEKEGYDLIEACFEYLAGFYDNNPFEGFTVDHRHNGKENEYLVEIFTKTGLIFDLIVIDNTHRTVKHLALKTF